MLEVRQTASKATWAKSNWNVAGGGTAAVTPKLLLPQLREIPEASPCWKILERSSWTRGMAFVSYGVPIGLRVTEAAQLDQMLAFLPPEWAPSPSLDVDSLFSLVQTASKSRTRPEPHLFLYQGSCRIGHTRDLQEALTIFESFLHAQVAALSSEKLFVHAGVVGWRGKAIVVPGRSFSGKTSLIAALVREGAEYLSDEYAVFDAEGRVHPYPKPLSFRDSAGQPLEKRTVESLGGTAARAALPVGLVLDTKYLAGRHWRPRQISPGAALLTLMDNTIQVRNQPQRTMTILQKAASGAAAVRSHRGEADAVAAWALKQLDSQFL